MARKRSGPAGLKTATKPTAIENTEGSQETSAIPAQWVTADAQLIPSVICVRSPLIVIWEEGNKQSTCSNVQNICTNGIID